jgi:hypothetical protein
MARMRQEQGQFAQALFGDMPERQRNDLDAGLKHVLDRLRALTDQGAAP